MKILYSQIKQLIPSLAATPAEIGEALTMTGFMQESLETVHYNDQPDVLLSFEIRQNRPDCLLSLIHISEPTRLLSISYAVFCLKKKNNKKRRTYPTTTLST